MCKDGAGIMYVDYTDARPTKLTRPLDVMFITSARDTRGEDQNGRVIRVNSEPRYMKGVIEETIREMHPGGALDGMVRVKAIVNDDMERDVHRSTGAYSLVPEPDKLMRLRGRSQRKGYIRGQRSM